MPRYLTPHVTLDELVASQTAARRGIDGAIIPDLPYDEYVATYKPTADAYGLDMIMIDYLQLITGSGSGRTQENRQGKISEISRMLKNLARELNIPVLCLSQLSRKVEERPGHRPMMSDLRESGSIEQDADIVMFIYREAYYAQENETVDPTTEVIVAKHRNGPTGVVSLIFFKEYARFENKLSGF